MSNSQKNKISKIPLFIIDAFTTGNNESFSGNPVSVCLFNYDDEITDETKLKIGKEMNHANTAFVSGGWSRAESLDSNESNHWAVRWVTPQTEVPLCGIGTLAAAHVIFTKVLRHREIYENETTISLQSKASGKLGATMIWSTGIVTLNFPSSPPAPFSRLNNQWMDELIKATVGPAIPPTSVDDIQFSNGMKVILLRLKVPAGAEPGAHLRQVVPDTKAMLRIVPEELQLMGVCVTVQGNGGHADPHFFSRMFSPWIGLNEDPVCGSMHTTLAPYWSRELKRDGETLLGRMVSPLRTGDLYVTVLGERVLIGGKNRVVVEGEMSL